MRAAILKRELDPGAELAALTASAKESGGLVSSVGLAREEEGKVATFVLEHHPVLTARSLLSIAAAAKAWFDVDAVAVALRTGTILPGEPIVFAGAAARHRHDAFLEADDLMDMLKTDAVFRKKERGPKVDRWIEPREQDYYDAARWHTVDMQERK